MAEWFEVLFMCGLKVRDLFASANIITTGNCALNFIGIYCRCPIKQERQNWSIELLRQLYSNNYRELVCKYTADILQKATDSAKTIFYSGICSHDKPREPGSAIPNCCNFVIRLHNYNAASTSSYCTSRDFFNNADNRNEVWTNKALQSAVMSSYIFFFKYHFLTTG